MYQTDNIDNKAVVQENDQWDCKVCSFLSENLRNTQLKQSQQQVSKTAKKYWKCILHLNNT